MAKNLLPISLILVLAFFAGYGLLHPGLPPTHDGEYHVVRFYEFYKALEEGQLYPRWAPDLNKGYGVPLFNYVYPLPNYVASLLHFLDISFIDAFKLNMFFATLAGAVFMYLWARQFWGDWGGVVASVFYTYSPYHFLDIYIRGSVGEVWALAFFPAFLWAVSRFLKDRNLIFMPIAALIFSLIILSHNILALMFFPFALTYMFFLCLQGESRKEMIVNTLYIILLGLGLSAIFWLPAIFERQFVRGLEVFDYREHFVEIYQLIFPSWGSGFSADPSTQGLSFQIGIANLIALGLILVCAFYSRSKYKKALKINIFFIFVTILVILLMLKVSQPIWEIFPLLRYFQFPWRLLSIIILSCAFLAGSLLYLFPKKVFAFFLIGLTFVLGVGYSHPAYYHQRDDSYYLTRPNFIDGTNVPGDSFNTIWMNTNLRRESEKVKLIKGEGELKIHSIKATTYKFQFDAKQDSEILVNTAFFPGWTAFINGEKKKLLPNKDGLISFDVKKGTHVVKIRFMETPLRTLAKNITLISSLVLSLLFVKSFRVRIKTNL